MKRKTALFLLLLSLELPLVLTCCTSSPEVTTSTSEETAATTADPLTTDIPHRDIVYPSAFDFTKPEEISDVFWMEDLLPGVTTEVLSKTHQIVQECTIGDVNFSLTIGLIKWAGRTTPEQIVQCARTFWYCYPQMYSRFKVSGTPTDVVLNIENEGYEVASTSGNTVHLYDGWLEGSKTDYDCLTHEFAHVVQTNWDGSFVPSEGSDTYMIERFADYCRYIYSYDSGRYNDRCWTLQTSKTENSYAKGVRFWVWVDYTYSTDEIDIMARIADAVQIKSRDYAARNWRDGGSAWTTVFKGTGAAGKTLSDLWAEYEAITDFSTLSSQSSGRPGKLSPLLSAYPIRETVKDRHSGSRDYLRIR